MYGNGNAFIPLIGNIAKTTSIFSVAVIIYILVLRPGVPKLFRKIVPPRPKKPLPAQS